MSQHEHARPPRRSRFRRHLPRGRGSGAPAIEVNGPALTVREVRALDNPYLPRTLEIRGAADEPDRPPAPGTVFGVYRGEAARPRAAGVGARLAPHAWLGFVLLAVFAFTVVPDLVAPILPGSAALMAAAFVGLALLLAAGLSLVRSSGRPGDRPGDGGVRHERSGVR